MGKMSDVYLQENCLQSKQKSQECEFSIALQKGPEDDLGIEAVSCEDGVHIEMVTEGILSKWNAENPLSAVKAGDHIIAVNDARGNCDALVADMMTAGSLKMLISRKAWLASEQA